MEEFWPGWNFEEGRGHCVSVVLSSRNAADIRAGISENEKEKKRNAWEEY